MTAQLAPERPPAAVPPDGQADATWLVVTAAAARGVAVAASGLILAAGLALLLWAVTPASGPESGASLRGGITAFAAANLMPISIGGIALTIPPLLLTVAIAALLATTARHGRYLPEGRYQESIAILTTTGAYGLVVAAATRGFAPPGTVPAAWVWTAPALALVAVTAGTLRRGSAWRGWWTDTAPDWAQVGVRGGGIGLGVMVAGGALALSVSLILNFVTIVGVSAIAAPSWTDGLGMTFLGLAYLPNAVIAGIGYISGVGFEVGAGTYSPLATVTVDLPAIPLLAAAPDQHGRSWLGLAFLIVPAIAAVLIARPVTNHLFSRSERILAAGTGAVLTSGAVTAIAAIARGGVGDGAWSVFGSPPLILGGVLTLEIAIIAVAIAALTGGREVRWRLAGPAEEVPDEGRGRGRKLGRRTRGGRAGASPRRSAKTRSGAARRTSTDSPAEGSESEEVTEDLSESDEAVELNPLDEDAVTDDDREGSDEEAGSNEVDSSEGAGVDSDEHDNVVELDLDSAGQVQSDEAGSTEANDVVELDLDSAGQVQSDEAGSPEADDDVVEPAPGSAATVAGEPDESQQLGRQSR